MPPLPAVPHTLRVTLKGTLGDDVDTLNRFYIDYSGSAPTDAELNTFAGSIASSWNTHLASFAFSDYTLTEVDIEDLSSSGAANGVWTGSHAGANTGEPLPAGAAVIVKFLGGPRIRGGHPKVFLPYAVAESLDSVQEWVPALISGLTTAFEAFITDLLTDGWTGAGTLLHVGVSFFHGFTNVLYPSGRYRAVPTARSSPLTWAITGYQVNPKVGSQRRRNLQSS